MAEQRHLTATDRRILAVFRAYRDHLVKRVLDEAPDDALMYLDSLLLDVIATLRGAGEAPDKADRIAAMIRQEARLLLLH